MTTSELPPEPAALGEPVGMIAADGALIDADGARPWAVKTPGPVGLADREGIFAHSFKCWVCDLEFVLLSWREDGHRVGQVACPECCEVTPMLHWRARLSPARDFGLARPEVYDVVPLGPAELMSDSSPPPSERFTAP